MELVSDVQNMHHNPLANSKDLPSSIPRQGEEMEPEVDGPGVQGGHAANLDLGNHDVSEFDAASQTTLGKSQVNVDKAALHESQKSKTEREISEVSTTSELRRSGRKRKAPHHEDGLIFPSYSNRSENAKIYRGVLPHKDAAAFRPKRLSPSKASETSTVVENAADLEPSVNLGPDEEWIRELNSSCRKKSLEKEFVTMEELFYRHSTQVPLNRRPGHQVQSSRDGGRNESTTDDDEVIAISVPAVRTKKTREHFRGGTIGGLDGTIGNANVPNVLCSAPVANMMRPNRVKKVPSKLMSY